MFGRLPRSTLDETLPGALFIRTDEFGALRPMDQNRVKRPLETTGDQGLHMICHTHAGSLPQRVDFGADEHPGGAGGGKRIADPGDQHVGNDRGEQRTGTKNHKVRVENRLDGLLVRRGARGFQAHLGHGAQTIGDAGLAVHRIALARAPGKTHELQGRGVHMPNTLEQALARANRTDERIGLFGKSHQQQVAERVVVDVGETMGERTSERGGGVSGQSGQALAHVSGRHDMLPLAQEASRPTIVGHGDHRVDMRPHEPEGRYEARLAGAAADGNRPEALIGHR